MWGKLDFAPSPAEITMKLFSTLVKDSSNSADKGGSISRGTDRQGRETLPGKRRCVYRAVPVMVIVGHASEGGLAGC